MWMLCAVFPLPLASINGLPLNLVSCGWLEADRVREIIEEKRFPELTGVIRITVKVVT
jgi:hypothetical protein